MNYSKATNVQDAMKCSLAVIKGLIRIKNSLFILSPTCTRLGKSWKAFPNISFRYFETDVEDDSTGLSVTVKGRHKQRSYRLCHLKTGKSGGNAGKFVTAGFLSSRLSLSLTNFCIHEEKDVLAIAVFS